MRFSPDAGYQKNLRIIRIIENILKYQLENTKKNMVNQKYMFRTLQKIKLI